MTSSFHSLKLGSWLPSCRLRPSFSRWIAQVQFRLSVALCRSSLLLDLSYSSTCLAWGSSASPSWICCWSSRCSCKSRISSALALKWTARLWSGSSSWPTTFFSSASGFLLSRLIQRYYFSLTALVGASVVKCGPASATGLATYDTFGKSSQCYIPIR